MCTQEQQSEKCGKQQSDLFDEFLADLPTEPSRVHCMFKRVLKKIYDRDPSNLDDFLNQCACYLVSVTSRQDEDLMRSVEDVMGHCSFSVASPDYEKITSRGKNIEFSVPAYKVIHLQNAITSSNKKFGR